MDDKTIDALSRFFDTLSNIFGPSGMVVLMILGFLGAVAFKVYNDYQRNRREQAALDAKQQTIDVPADQNRDLRVQIAKKDGWSDETINRLILQNLPENALVAQQLLNQSKDVEQPDERSRRQRRVLEEK